MIEALLSHTPEFLAGFALNLLMTVCTMVAGTLVGMGLGALRQWPRFGWVGWQGADGHLP